MKSKPLDNKYSAEFQTIGEKEWYGIIEKFSDANIYQTWAYEKVRQGEKNCSYFVLRYREDIVAAAKVRIKKLPLPGFGAAYIRWAPLWRKLDNSADPEVFRMAIRALRNEFVLKRGLFLRIFPLLYDDIHSDLASILYDEGYTSAFGEKPQQTLLLNIESNEDEIRINLKQKWRNCLNKSEKNDLDLTEGTHGKLFEEFIKIYQALLMRKRFSEPNDINEFRTIQKLLPAMHKMHISLTGKDGEISCGSITTAIGDTGVYLFGACNDKGMKTNGSYLLQWKTIQWMKQNGCRWYNLNGINQKTNPGTYHFKTGVAGKKHRCVSYLGRFDSYNGNRKAIIIYMANAIQIKLKRILAGKSRH